uniref:Mannose-1-phosphate guanyltransferase n=1 Tax=Bionectria ochroleuca TaxID=29856 RepID=A0A8H7TN19_BIOOC
MSLQVPHRPKEGSTKAVILVGGPSRGTRFRPLSLDVPKPLFEVAGHPIIWHCISAIAAVGSIHDVYIIGYYDESVFRDFIKDASKEFPVLSSIKYLREYEALGTAGGLYHFRDAILKGRPERLFVLNADVCCSFPLADMLKLAQDKDAEAVILGTRVSDEAATNFGCIVSDAHTKRVLHYVEKPESRISNLINCGVYLFSTEAIFPSIRSAMKRRLDRPARLLSYPSSDNLETSYLHAQAADDDDDDEEGRKTEVIRLEQDILGDMADSKQFFVYETKDFWRQIKTAGSAVPANALYLQRALQSGSEELAQPSANIVPPSSSTPPPTSTPPPSSAPTSASAPAPSWAPAPASRSPSSSRTQRSSTTRASSTPSSAGAAASAPGPASRAPPSPSPPTPPASSRTASRSRASPSSARTAASATRSASRTASACPTRS